MKFFYTDHTFNEPWETVVQAATRKYPNPMNSSVIAVDVVDRNLRPDGVLYSHRLLTTFFRLGMNFPVIGNGKIAYVSEHSLINAQKRNLTMYSRNLCLQHFVNVDEKLEYIAHPDDPKNKTLLKHEANVSVTGFSFMNGSFESVITNNLADKAKQGLQAMDWVISKIKAEITSIQS